MSKEDRDTYVENNYSSKTNKQLAADTGWSETTIKSIKTRLGVVKSSRVKELEEYVLSNGIKSVDEVNNAAIVLGCKPDKIRDVMKSLGIFESQSDKAFEALKLKYTGKFIFGEYKNTKAYVELTCVECKAVHYKRPNDLVTYNFSCTCIRKAIKAEYTKQKEDSKIKAAALKIEKDFLDFKGRFPLVVAILPDSKVK